jgi:hypothetical protein
VGALAHGHGLPGPAGWPGRATLIGAGPHATSARSAGRGPADPGGRGAGRLGRLGLGRAGRLVAPRRPIGRCLRTRPGGRRDGPRTAPAARHPSRAG